MTKKNSQLSQTPFFLIRYAPLLSETQEPITCHKIYVTIDALFLHDITLITHLLIEPSLITIVSYLHYSGTFNNTSRSQKHINSQVSQV